MPKYKAIDKDGNEIPFEWYGDAPPTDADVDEIVAAGGKKISAGAGDPVEPELATSHEPAGLPGPLEAITRGGQGLYEDVVKPMGRLVRQNPALAGGMAGGMLGGPLGVGAGVGLAALGGAGGAGYGIADRALTGGGTGPPRVSPSMASDVTEMGLNAVEQGVGQAAGVGVAKGLTKLGRVAATNALGSQAGVRKAFPTVDLEGVAIREGMPNAAKTAQLSSQANKAIEQAHAAATAAGKPNVMPQDMNANLRPLYNRMRRAGLSENAQDISQAMVDSHRRYPGGLPRGNAQILKEELGIQGKAAQQGAADPRAAGMAARIAKEKSSGITGALRQDPATAAALTRSQEMMALKKAMTNASGRTPTLRNLMVLAPVIGGGAGYYKGGDAGSAATGALTTGAAGLALTNPAVLRLLARLFTSSAPAGREGTRALTSMLVPSHEPED